MQPARILVSERYNSGGGAAASTPCMESIKNSRRKYRARILSRELLSSAVVRAFVFCIEFVALVRPYPFRRVIAVLIWLRFVRVSTYCIMFVALVDPHPFRRKFSVLFWVLIVYTAR